MRSPLLLWVWGVAAVAALALVCVPGAQAHGFLKSPISRNYFGTCIFCIRKLHVCTELLWDNQQSRTCAHVVSFAII